jgi:hypothetical protein
MMTREYDGLSFRNRKEGERVMVLLCKLVVGSKKMTNDTLGSGEAVEVMKDSAAGLITSCLIRSVKYCDILWLLRPLAALRDDGSGVLRSVLTFEPFIGCVVYFSHSKGSLRLGQCLRASSFSK